MTAPTTPIPDFMSDFGTASIEARVIYQNNEIQEIQVFREAKAALTPTANHKHSSDRDGSRTGSHHQGTRIWYRQRKARCPDATGEIRRTAPVRKGVR